MALRATPNKLSINVSQYRPEELSVNISGRMLVVEGHQAEKLDEGGTIERHFVRKFTLPDHVKEEDIEPHLQEDGMLTVTLSKPEPMGPSKNIPIQVDPNWKPNPSKALVLRNPIPMWWF